MTRVAAGIAYRESGPSDPEALPVLCLHGWPQSSYMWRHLIADLAAAGRRAIAPDLAGFGDSPPDPPGTWERQVEAVERFRTEVGLERVVLAVHDTGGAIGLRWACDHPEAVGGLVISNTGFFPDFQFAEIAESMRTPIEGEALVDSLSREGFGTLLGEISTGIDQQAIDEYWKAFATPASRRGMLELYRSFDPADMGPYERRLAGLGAPALVLWGQADDFLPSDYAERFVEDIQDAELVRLEGVGHFLYEDEPRRCADEVLGFLERTGI